MDGPHVHRVALIIVAVAESIEGCWLSRFEVWSFCVGIQRSIPAMHAM